MSQINLEAFKEHYGEDIDIVGDLIEIFETTYPETLSAIELALLNENYKDLELHAHTLKGMCANFFCEELKDACYSLENMGKKSELSDHEAQLAKLKEDLPKLIEELKSLS